MPCPLLQHRPASRLGTLGLRSTIPRFLRPIASTNSLSTYVAVVVARETGFKASVCSALLFQTDFQVSIALLCCSQRLAASVPGQHSAPLLFLHNLLQALATFLQRPGAQPESVMPFGRVLWSKLAAKVETPPSNQHSYTLNVMPTSAAIQGERVSRISHHCKCLILGVAELSLQLLSPLRQSRSPSVF